MKSTRYPPSRSTMSARESDASHHSAGGCANGSAEAVARPASLPLTEFSRERAPWLPADETLHRTEAGPCGSVSCCLLSAASRSAVGGSDELEARRAGSWSGCKQSAAFRAAEVRSRRVGEASIECCCARRPPAKSACLEGPILEAHIGTLHSPAVSHLLSDTTFPQLGILRVPLFVPVLAGFLLRTTQVRSAPQSRTGSHSSTRLHPCTNDSPLTSHVQYA
mmetsp:Transcript_14988/g.44331  ORF Transcript_14988/g.44331 Transcript_14988/m.44331 type:complete len:222 (-) Transcript_14988:556-1221(-)